MKRIAPLLFCLVLPNCLAQQKSAELKRYSECQFGNDFSVVEVHELNHELDRPANFSKASRTLRVVDGYSIYVAYKEEEPFANMKAEQLRAETYEDDRAALVQALGDNAAGTRNMESSTPAHYQANGFDVYGINRKALEGNVLATYLVLNGKAHTATTIYLLNDVPEERKFNNIEQFRQIRDAFLKAMIECFKQP